MNYIRWVKSWRFVCLMCLLTLFAYNVSGQLYIKKETSEMKTSTGETDDQSEEDFPSEEDSDEEGNSSFEEKWMNNTPLQSIATMNEILFCTAIPVIKKDQLLPQTALSQVGNPPEMKL